MSYLVDLTKVNANTAIHQYSGLSGSDFTYSIPSSLGEGVTRPSATEFTLAAGRSYVLIMSISMDNATNPNWNYFDTEYRIRSSTGTFYGNTGALRFSRSSSALPPPAYVQARKNPYYRSEAVAFIPSSSIITSITVTLRQTSTASDGTDVPSYTQTSGNPAGCVIISVPD